MSYTRSPYDLCIIQRDFRLYVIRGALILHTETGDYTLEEGDSLVFDSSIGHTYINQKNIMAAFMVINYYPN